MLITYHIPLTTKIPNDILSYPEEIRKEVISKAINPPLLEKTIEEDELILALRQNGWRMTKRHGRLYLSREIK